MEFKKTPKPLTEDFKVGDMFRFMIVNPEYNGQEDYSKLQGSALVSDYHQEDDTYNIIIWDYKNKPLATTGKAPILDVKHAGMAQVMSDTGIAQYKMLGLTGAHPDKNFEDFKDEVVDDLGKLSKDTPEIGIYFIVLEMAESNTLAMLQAQGSPLELDEETGKLNVIKKDNKKP